MLKKETLKKVLLDTVDRIDAGNSDYNDEELEEIVSTMNKITNTQNKLSKYQASKYLGVSTSTFDNYVRAGKIPKGQKELGFKELFWDLDAIKKIKYEIKH